MSEVTFDFNLFLKESKETLLNPKSYFSAMKTTGGITEPLIKAVIYGTATGVIYLLWGLLRIGAVTGGMLGSAVGFMAFMGAIIGSVVGLFVGAIVLLIISSIAKGNSDFEANLRVAASLLVVWPIYAFLGFTAGINIYFGTVISILVFIYSLWLLYHGLVESLKCDPATSRIVGYVLAGIIVLILLMGLSARNRMMKMTNELKRDKMELLKDS
jgi:hypothetical protein